MVVVVVEEVGRGQVGEEVHRGPKEQRQPACPSRQLLTLKLWTKRNHSNGLKKSQHSNVADLMHSILHHKHDK